MAVQSRIDNVVKPFVLYGTPKIIDGTISGGGSYTSGNVTDTTTYPVADQDTLTEVFSIDGGAEQTVLFAGATTTALQVAAQINDQIVGGSAVVTGGQVVVSSDSTGTASSVAIGTGTGALTWGTPVAGTGPIALASKTAVVQDPTNEEWSALIDVTATDGSEFPRGIFYSDTIPAATIAAGDVANQRIIVGGDITVDEDQIVLQNSIALSDEITNQNLTVRSALTSLGIAPEATQNLTQHENA